jgi:hypothetical protein
MSPEIRDLQQYLQQTGIHKPLLIKHHEEFGHVVEIYSIKTIQNITCFNCKNKAIFLTYEKTHGGEKSADLSCSEHSPSVYFEYLESIK